MKNEMLATTPENHNEKDREDDEPWKNFKDEIIKSTIKEEGRTITFLKNVSAKKMVPKESAKMNETGKLLYDVEKSKNQQDQEAMLFNEGTLVARDENDDYIFLAMPSPGKGQEEKECYFWVSEEELKKKTLDEKGGLQATLKEHQKG